VRRLLQFAVRRLLQSFRRCARGGT
jgi:hypothetical protein